MTVLLPRTGPRKKKGRSLASAPLAATIGMACCGATLLGLTPNAFAQMVPQTLDGPPIQMQPYAPEPGVPLIAIAPGTPNPFGGADGMGGAGGVGGGADGGAAGDGLGGAGGIGGIGASGDALNTMMGTPWGAAAIANAEALGVNPSAVAATCVIESGCVNEAGPGTVAGAFQMKAATYTAMINAAVTANPSLASSIVPGLAGQMDPATESIAASEYLLQGAQYLQSTGISDPTVLQVRGYYNFGPVGGAAVANAPPTALMSNELTMYTPAQLAANGITPGETVGQWQTSVASKIGNAATQSIITS